MVFSSLELTLLSLICTVIGAIVAGIVVRYLSTDRFVTKNECESRHASDCRDSSEMTRKIEELRRQHEQSQASTDIKISTIFRMVRGFVVYSDYPPEIKEKILNERGDADG